MLRRRPGGRPIPPRIALGAPPSSFPSTGEVTRAPLYINRANRGWIAPDLLPNLAVLVVLAAFVSPALVEPVYSKKPAVQVDQYTNIAVTQQTQTPAGRYLDPQIWSYRIQPDLYPNLATNPQTQTLTLAGSYIEPIQYKKLTPAPDIYPNVAALRPAVAAAIPAPIEPQLAKRPPLAPDLFPNLSAQTEIVPIIRAPTFITASWKGWPTPDIFPNVTVQPVPIAPIIRTPLYTVIWPRFPPQVDVYPNVADIAVVRQAAFVEDQVYIATRRIAPPQIDQSLNLAALLFVPPPVFLPPACVDPITWKPGPPQIDVITNVPLMLSPAIGNITVWDELPPYRWPQVDFYPNIAIEGVISAPTPPPPIEPTYTWRWAQAPELFPNIAVQATPAAALLIRSTLEPTYTTKYTLQFEYFPNIAVGVVPVIPVSPVAGRAGNRVIIPPKRQGETIIFNPSPFNFISQLGQGETISSATVTASVYIGIDANPGAIVSGSATVSGPVVSQKLTGGIIGVIYDLDCLAVTNLGQTIGLTGYLAVIPNLV